MFVLKYGVPEEEAPVVAMEEEEVLEVLFPEQLIKLVEQLFM
tara:strand:- start:511 stop:636 length:126 start_codon:yes stop_codon:yes gene_type:complete